MYACTYTSVGSFNAAFSCQPTDNGDDYFTLNLSGHASHIYLDREAAQQLVDVVTEALAWQPESVTA